MPFKYPPPGTVLSPRDFVDSVNVIHDDGAASYSLAEIEWEGKKCIAIRWNVARREQDDPNKQSGAKMSVGMPSSHGIPVWFILPDDLFDKNSAAYKKLQKFL